MKRSQVVQTILIALLCVAIYGMAFGGLITRVWIAQDYSRVIPSEEVEQFIRAQDPELEHLRGELAWQVASNGDLLVFERPGEPVMGLVEVPDVDTLYGIVVQTETTFQPNP
jgi:hypothetical protein